MIIIIIIFIIIIVFNIYVLLLLILWNPHTVYVSLLLTELCHLQNTTFQFIYLFIAHLLKSSLKKLCWQYSILAITQVSVSVQNSIGTNLLIIIKPIIIITIK